MKIGVIQVVGYTLNVTGYQFELRSGRKIGVMQVVGYALNSTGYQDVY
jgi:hypothetical protein